MFLNFVAIKLKYILKILLSGEKQSLKRFIEKARILLVCIDSHRISLDCSGLSCLPLPRPGSPCMHYLPCIVVLKKQTNQALDMESRLVASRG